MNDKYDRGAFVGKELIPPGMLSRYSTKMVNPAFYKVLEHRTKLSAQDNKRLIMNSTDKEILKSIAINLAEEVVEGYIRIKIDHCL